MSDYMNLPGTQLRVDLKELTGRRGLGVVTLGYNLELIVQSSESDFTNTLLLVHGHLFLSFEKGSMHYVGAIHTTAPIIGRKPTTMASFATDLRPEQLAAIEAERKDGSLTLMLHLHGAAFAEDGTMRPLHHNQLQLSVDAGVWAKVLEQCGYGTRFITNLPNEGPSA